MLRRIPGTEADGVAFHRDCAHGEPGGFAKGRKVGDADREAAERQACAYKRGGLPEEQRAVVREAAAQPADGVEGLHHFIQGFGDGDDVESGSDVGIVVVRWSFKEKSINHFL